MFIKSFYICRPKTSVVMIILMVLIFVLGYMCIALEHRLKIDKAAISLVMFGLIWTVYALFTGGHGVSHELIEHLGETCETLIFLIGAMTIVDLIDSHGGFYVITKHIKSRNKFKLLWIIAVITFFMSAILDNLTTTIVMVMMLRKLVSQPKDRWLFTGMVIIAANSGGAWSPIGDVTTIMLWMRGNVTTAPLISYLIVPCIVSLLIPLIFTSFRFKKNDRYFVSRLSLEHRLPQGVGERFSRGLFFAGVLALLSVPVLKALFGIPPYVGVMFALGGLWVLTEIIYGNKKELEESAKNRVSKVVKHIDMPTILFFLGILMSVAGLQTAGILTSVANFLDTEIHDVFAITTIVGVLSSIVDNVPLVAGCMGMYPIADADMIAACADPTYMQAFTQDGLFWLLLTYCAGVGGSILIIGSAAGVIAMGLEKIDFVWYFKNVTLIAFIGYLAGVAVLYLESILFL